jgi:uncharacterized membrane protein YeaQ/YmgE (transglycosylase-associated protein family)
MINNIEYLFGFLLMGGVIGWLTGLIIKGRGFGIAGDVVVGIVGAFLGGALFRILGQSTYNPLGGFVTALVGSAALVVLTRFIKRSRPA